MRTPRLERWAVSARAVVSTSDVTPGTTPHDCSQFCFCFGVVDVDAFIVDEHEQGSVGAEHHIGVTGTAPRKYIQLNEPPTAGFGPHMVSTTLTWVVLPDGLPAAAMALWQSERRLPFSLYPREDIKSQHPAQF